MGFPFAWINCQVFRDYSSGRAKFAELLDWNALKKREHDQHLCMCICGCKCMRCVCVCVCVWKLERDPASEPCIKAEHILCVMTPSWTSAWNMLLSYILCTKSSAHTWWQGRNDYTATLHWQETVSSHVINCTHNTSVTCSEGLITCHFYAYYATDLEGLEGSDGHMCVCVWWQPIGPAGMHCVPHTISKHTPNVLLSRACLRWPLGHQDY